MPNEIKIDESIAKKVLDTVDAGLSNGLGTPVPGQMCVEAAVCYALGLEHGDDPKCVSPSLRSLKIRLNDSAWSSNEARAKGLRRLALAQLGSLDTLDERLFVENVIKLVIGVYVPIALRNTAEIHPDKKHQDALEAAALRCEKERTREAANAAFYTADASSFANNAANAIYATAAISATSANNVAAAAISATSANAAAAASYAISAAAASYAISATSANAARDDILARFAEDVVQILVEMKAPGCKWLFLTE